MDTTDPKITFDEDDAKFVGNKSIVVSIDVKKTNNGYYFYTENEKNNTQLDPANMVNDFQALGVGEIVINLIEL